MRRSRLEMAKLQGQGRKTPPSVRPVFPIYSPRRVFHEVSRAERPSQQARRPVLRLYPLRLLIAAVLMQRRGGGAAVRAGLEGDLRVHRFEEEFFLSFGEDLEFWLVGELGEHVGALPRECQGDARR